MDGNEAQLAKIKDAIKKGELTKEIIERRLKSAIDAELRKTDSPADMELINACQDLLWEINMHGEPYHSNQQQSLAALREKLAKMERAKKRKRRVLGIAMASFLLVVGSFAVDTALHRQWLEGEQAPDEQQYIISGQENNPGLLTESQAGNEPNKLYTSCATNRFFLFMSVQKLNNHKRVMVSHNTLAEASCESKYSFGFFLIPIFPESQLH